jgi:hypothetical protein
MYRFESWSFTDQLKQPCEEKKAVTVHSLVVDHHADSTISGSGLKFQG